MEKLIDDAGSDDTRRTLNLNPRRTGALADSRGLTFIDGDNEESSDDENNLSKTENNEDDIFIDGACSSYSSQNSILSTPRADDI